MPTLAEQWFQKGFEEGLAEARKETRLKSEFELMREAEIRFILRQFRRHCDSLYFKVEQQVKALSSEQIYDLALETIDFNSVDDFAKWIVEHSDSANQST